MQEVHKAGPLKQVNKGHKGGRHRSNRAIEAAAKGRVDVKTLTKRRKELDRDGRRNQIKQIQKKRHDDMVASKRSIGRDATPPILVAIYSYSGQSITPLLDLIKKCDENATVRSERDGSVHLAVPRFKLRYQFLVIPTNDLFAVLDAAKVADILVLLHPINLASGQLEDDPVMTAVYSHVLPTTVHVVTGFEAIAMKRRADVKKNLQKLIEGRFPDEKLHVVDKPQDSLQLLHSMGNCKRRRISYRRHRAQVLAESFTFEQSTENTDFGKLVVSGYVRNKRLNANGLVHIPGWGDFQMDMIESAIDPYPFSSRIKGNGSTMDIEGSSLIQKADPLVQESLEAENPLDPMEGEQTWPTPEEIASAQDANKPTRRVVKGTSEYQAAWILEDGNRDAIDEEDDGDESDEDGSDVDMDRDGLKAMSEDGSEDEEDQEGDEEFETITVAEDNDEVKYDEKLDEEEEAATLRKFQDAKQNELFPDEVDTPGNVPAKVRFARYRGLKSFAYSSWDPKENLPSDYSRIFQFENFNRTRRRVVKQCAQADDDDDLGAAVGLFVRVHIKDVPLELFKYFEANRTTKPLVLYGLLQHEQKMSVLNLVLKQSPLFTERIEAKERLVFHVGCRRFYANPIFSSHTNGTKFKYERFLRTDEATVASVYAPITYAPASVVVFKEYADGSQVLVATGSLLSVSPDRLVIKRIVLSGHPFKISSRNAVVRYMFHNKEDILWFMPVELRSKYGRKGHIREPLGTHGHMKCTFDRALTSQDTVMMNLYKRIFPKWTYEAVVQDPGTIAKSTYQEMKE